MRCTGGVLRELGRLLQGEVSETAREPAIVEPRAPTDLGSPASDTSAPPPNPDASRIAALVEKAGPGAPQPERRKALQALAKMGSRARDEMPVFLLALEDDDPVIRGEALRALPKLLPDPQIGVAAVTPLLRDSDPANHVWAANALADFGQTSAAATYLTAFLKGEAKIFAAEGLTRLGPEAKSAVPFLTDMLEQRQDAHEAYAACMALAAIGREAGSALPALQAASQDPDPTTRNAASYAIKEIDAR